MKITEIIDLLVNIDYPIIKYHIDYNKGVKLPDIENNLNFEEYEEQSCDYCWE